MYHILIILSLLTILGVCYIAFRKEIATPAFLFTLGMCVCAINLLNFVSVWGIRIHHNTFSLVVGGCLFMTLGAFLCDRFNHKLKSANMPQKKFCPISVKALRFIMVYLVLVSLLQIYFINRHYGTGNLAANLFLHTEAMKFGDTRKMMQLPRLVAYFMSTPTTMGYVFAFLLPTYICQGDKYKTQKLWIFIDFIICLCSSLLDGGRSHMLHIIVTCGVFYMMAIRYHRRRLDLKRILAWILLSFVFLSGFQQLGYLIGREKGENTAYQTVGVYCGAQIQNLDDYINENHKINASYLGEYTFRDFYAKFENVGAFELKSKVQDLLIFNNSKGYGLGNVYSAFQSYYVDFGVEGTFLLCFLIGWFMQWLYLKIRKNSDFMTGVISLNTYLYAIIISSMFMSFFSEAFFAKVARVISFAFWFNYILIFLLLYRRTPWKNK